MATEEHDAPQPAERSGKALAPGLYLVGTPIGNLEDITLRALRVLRSADRILCEDTRETQHLLQHFGIQKPLVSCHEHNEEARAVAALAWLRAGERLAVVSDAGTPGISDPGMRLARAAIEAGLPVVPVPGANAALAALVASGLGAESFLFAGFLPPKAGARRTELERVVGMLRGSGRTETLVLYEAPHRVLEMLADVEAVCGPACPVVVARELTKLFEEFLRGSVAEVRAQLAARERVRGEMVVLLEIEPVAGGAETTESLGEQVRRLMTAEGLSEMDALKRAARERGLGKSDAYRQWQRERERGRRR